jgi:hypothetical protein
MKAVEHYHRSDLILLILGHISAVDDDVPANPPLTSYVANRS